MQFPVVFLTSPLNPVELNLGTVSNCLVHLSLPTGQHTICECQWSVTSLKLIYVMPAVYTLNNTVTEQWKAWGDVRRHSDAQDPSRSATFLLNNGVPIHFTS